MKQLLEGSGVEHEKGIAYLIGAGPGGLGLLTIRGRECLRRSDVVLYDALVDPAILEEAPENARRISVGKRAGQHTLPQEETTRLLVELVAAGNIVARLKGGDPYIFGRGGEEARALSLAGLRFEVVPGVTAASAAAAYGGIPLTHRGLAPSVTLVTGREEGGSPVDWRALATGGTLCIYMGVDRLAENCRALIDGGREPDEPAALVVRAATPRQRVIEGTLSTIAERAEGAETPALLLVGKVVELRSACNWLERRPLFGRTILVIRSRRQAGELSGTLRDMGARVIETPAFSIQPTAYSCPDAVMSALADKRPLEKEDVAACDPLSQAVLHLANCEGKRNWVVFTSVNGVEETWRRILALGLDARVFGRSFLAAVGPGTASAMAERGLKADVLPEKYCAQSLAAAIAESAIPSTGACYLFQGDLASGTLLEGLIAAGMTCEPVECYRNVPESEASTEALEAWIKGEIDAVAFTSGSSARNFMRLFPSGSPAGRPRYVSIGPVTSREMEDGGLAVDGQAGEATIAGLAEAILQLLRR